MSDGAPSANSFGMDHREKEKVQLKFEVARRTERQFAPRLLRPVCAKQSFSRRRRSVILKTLKPGQTSSRHKG